MTHRVKFCRVVFQPAIHFHGVPTNCNLPQSSGLLLDIVSSYSWSKSGAARNAALTHTHTHTSHPTRPPPCPGSARVDALFSANALFTAATKFRRFVGCCRRPNSRVLRNSGMRSTPYRGTSLIRNCDLLEPYSRNMHRALWWVLGGGRFLMSEAPLYFRQQTNSGVL